MQLNFKEQRKKSQLKLKKNRKQTRGYLSWMGAEQDLWMNKEQLPSAGP